MPAPSPRYKGLANVTPVSLACFDDGGAAPLHRFYDRLSLKPRSQIM